MKRYDYENMLGLIQLDIKNYQHRLSLMQSNSRTEDDAVIMKQAGKIIEEIRALERFVKCALGEL